ncbi:hypothetical protein [Corynebacterium lubricantis]|uniref:hypothetical protein n=1 Tax=Corynebacterium lubricantis TaxID=541095 RepID=UPI00037D43B4|nr:hypothetical protein [Corynebacterium lubricantis]
MTHKLSFFDRLAALIAGLLLVVGGLIPVGFYFEIPYVSPWLRSLDFQPVLQLHQQSWYVWALGIIAFVLVVVGGSMLATNLRGRGFSRRDTGDEETGKTTLHIGRLAGAIGDHMKESEPVTGVDSSVSMVKQRPTITFTVHADPHADLRMLVHLIENVEADFRDAVEDLDIDTVYKLHLNRVDP